MLLTLKINRWRVIQNIIDGNTAYDAIMTGIITGSWVANHAAEQFKKMKQA